MESEGIRNTPSESGPIGGERISKPEGEISTLLTQLQIRGGGELRKKKDATSPYEDRIGPANHSQRELVRPLNMGNER